MIGKRFKILAMAALCLALSGCAGLANRVQTSMYDDEGLIAQEADSYTALIFNGSVQDEMSFDGFTGSCSVLDVSVPVGGGKLLIEYDVSVSKGDFKIVLVQGAKQVEAVCEGTGEGTRTFDLEAGNQVVKVVGDGAASTVALGFKATEGVTARPADVFSEGWPLEDGEPEPLQLDALDV
ncbi:hypothetical protein [Arabiibacter massiliensis]|uniref:hypothetical protein n=1 Tax=Arabiibacter massiliensis TaxID=1870985 RepID=UPI0011799E51|nr:hypothetical protein [Arabiibacter massiliensis]